jgi:ATP-dependent RNA helicase DeaD
VHDLRARRLELTRGALEQALEGDDLARYRVIVDALAGEYDVLDIAAAAVKLADTAAGDGTHDEEEIPTVTPHVGEARRRERRSPGTGVVRIYVGLGRRAGIRPGDLVGAITNEARLASNAIGAIDIADRFSLVEVPMDQADAIIRALRKTTIRGKKPLVRRDRDA